jgi:beta-N-acetylhexosaminidase
MSLAIIRLMLVALLLPLALVWREPFLADIRSYLFVGLLVLPAAIAAIEMVVIRRSRTQPRTARTLSVVMLAVAALDLSSVIAIEARFRWIRSQVLHAEPDQLATLGRHILVGFRNSSELHELVERRAIAGVFVTSRNVHAVGSAGLEADVQSLQDIRRRQGLPPLWVATDQEGGAVSRLSPPLSHSPALSEVVGTHPDPIERKAAIRQLANAQGRELADLGVNLNFAPVVDLNYHLVDPDDRYTRIYQRAIASDPNIVRDVAGEYCAALLETGVHCTLKHFPGLGRVHGDTHLEAAELTASASDLAATDWVPFRTLMEQNTFTMLGHVRLTEIDPDHPVSVSRPVISGLLRRDWHYNGVLITDDFGMAAIYRSRGGIEGAAVEAINAGVDLILVSFDPDQYYPVMHALLDAYRDGHLRQDVLPQSDQRLDHIQQALQHGFSEEIERTQVAVRVFGRRLTSTAPRQ